jgi:hypothetical protein
VASGLISVQASQTAVAATTKTTVTTNTVVVMFGQAAASAPTWSGWTTTSPGALTELYDNQLAGNASVGAAWATKPTAGATGAGVATLSAAERNGGILIALRAAAVATAPTVTTQPVTAITATTATGNGNITALGSPNPTQYGVVWDTAINPTVALATKTAQGPIAVTGAFTSAITGLTPNTLYHVRAYATNTAGTSYGADVTFTTLPPVAPTVTTQAVTAITAATATGNGNITALGSPNPTQYGVVWDIAINPTVALATKTAQGAIAVTGAFTSSITGLAPNTLYHVRAYATNTAGTSYGADVTFTTLPPVAPTVTTQAVTAIAANTATGNGNITALGVPNPTQYGIVWNTATNPTVALATKTTQGVPAGVGAFTSAITGLTPGTLYYVRAYATNTAGTSYGANVTFTTSLTALTITASAGAGGTITPSGAVPVAGGANQAFDITPNPTFILSDVLVDGVSVGRANSYTFNAVNANHTIAASFNGGWSAPTGSTNVVVITNPNNVFTSNNTYTRYWGLGEGADYINFNIPAIPAGSTINGIEVAVEGNSVGGMNMQVQLSGNNGTTFTAVTPARITNLLAADSTVILGGAGDTWGKAWSNTEFTNANFRVRMLSAPPATNRKDIDQLQVKVTYTLPVTAPTVTTNPATGVTTTGATFQHHRDFPVRLDECLWLNGHSHAKPGHRQHQYRCQRGDYRLDAEHSLSLSRCWGEYWWYNEWLGWDLHNRQSRSTDGHYEPCHRRGNDGHHIERHSQCQQLQHHRDFRIWPDECLWLDGHSHAKPGHWQHQHCCERGNYRPDPEHSLSLSRRWSERRWNNEWWGSDFHNQPRSSNGHHKCRHTCDDDRCHTERHGQCQQLQHDSNV